MFNKILRIKIVILLIQSTLSLNTADLCNSLACKGNYNYKCSKDICGLTAKACYDYHNLERANLFRSYHILRNLHTNIIACESLRLNKNDYCLNNLKCFKQQYVLTKSGFKSIKMKVDCKCEGKHWFKCGDYCTQNIKHCDLLNNSRVNPSDFQKCF
jgi:hypothetical protein